MAKILVNVDTETDTLEVLVNGEAQPNVQSAQFSLYESYTSGETELSSMICLFDKNKESGITTVTWLTAKQCKEGKAALSAGAKLSRKYTDLVETQGSDKLKLDIAKYMGLS